MSRYRQNDDLHDLRSTCAPWRLSDLATAIGVVILVCSFYVLAQAIDDRDAEREEAVIAAERQGLHIAADLQAAYERGLVDAAASLLDHPDGARLAQTCAALASVAP